MNYQKIKFALKRHSSPAKAKVLKSFFKTGKGQYGEGDVFIGVQVPDLRRIAKQYLSTSHSELSLLIQSPIHEERLLAIFILVFNFKKANHEGREKIIRFYLKHKKFVNNWDLVDQSAYFILGAHSFNNQETLILDKMIKSKQHWERRTAIVATLAFIRNSETALTFKYAQLLLKDREDLMHKATGWMLREAGKRDPQGLRNFLKTHGPEMPRTMLRYSIEKFSPLERKKILSQTLSSKKC